MGKHIERAAVGDACVLVQQVQRRKLQLQVVASQEPVGSAGIPDREVHRIRAGGGIEIVGNAGTAGNPF